MTAMPTQDRVPTSLSAEIVTDRGALPIACVITDLSASGAKIEVASALELPLDFELTIPATRETMRAEVRWRYDTKVGVRFVRGDEASAAGPTRETLAAENVKLWAVLETLAKRLTQLGERVVLPADLTTAAALAKDFASGRDLAPARRVVQAAAPV